MITACLYQTVENRENPDEVESNAPFKCTNPKAWLGEGYYFWETFDVCAHKWGESIYGGNYFICEVFASYDCNEVLDLVGNTEQIKDVSKIAQILEKDYDTPIMVPLIIRYLKTRVGFTYKMIRVHSIDAFPSVEPLNYRFVNHNKSYLSLRPIIQCCVLNKSILQLPVRIVYPPEYVEASCI